MNIDIIGEGIIKRRSESNDLKFEYVLELPLVFQKISTGPRGINSASIQKIVRLKDSINDVSVTKINSYNGNTSNETLAVKQIVDRPVKFQTDEGESDNSLVFVIDFNDKQNVLDFSSNSKVEVDIYLRLFFTNDQRLDLIVECEIVSEELGKLVLKKIRRKNKRLETKINLLALIIVIGLLFGWNYFFNRDVYEQEHLLSQEVITGIVGFLIAFFGLSIKKFKSSFSVFTDLHSFLRYPELHLSLSQFNGIASPSWAMALGTVALASTLIIYDFWSVNVSADSNYRIYDRQEKKIVNSQRIYKKQLIGKSRFTLLQSNNSIDDRFVLIKNSKEQDLKSNYFPYGKINEKGEVAEMDFIYKYEKNLNGKNTLIGLKTSEINGHTMINGSNTSISIKTDDLIGNFPSNEFDEYFVEYRKDLSTLEAEIVLKKHKEFTINEIEMVIDSFKKSNFDITDKLNPIFKNRVALEEILHKSLKRTIDNKSRIKIETIVAITLDEIGSINNSPKKAVERTVILKALWRLIGVEDLVLGRPNQMDIKTICKSWNSILNGLNNWKMDRSILGFLMELHKNTPSDINNYPIQFMDSSIVSSKRHSNKRDFIVVSALTNSTSSIPIQKYLKKYITDLKSKHGLEKNEDIFKLIIATEKSKARNDDFVKSDESILEGIIKLINNS